MFYRMKVKHEQEVMDRKCHAHQQEVRQLQEVVSGRLRTLHTALGRVRNTTAPLIITSLILFPIPYFTMLFRYIYIHYFYQFPWIVLVESLQCFDNQILYPRKSFSL